MDNFAERLRKERERMSLNQEDFGAIGGVKKLAQHRYEQGDRQPDSDYLQRLAAAGVDVEYVLTGVKDRFDTLNQGQETLIKEIAARLYIQLDIKPEEVAAELGIDYPYFEGMMEGKIAPPLSVLTGLVNSFGIDAQWLLTGKSYQAEFSNELDDAERNLIKNYRKASSKAKAVLIEMSEVVEKNNPT